ncbi:hypothetical protein PAB09_00935 [Corynebacterium sp. SCR221107]|nr:hypothetical protein [Corynebacterium sp. SCR221107]WBT08951.1 hypothetical protein PAB09_00935 [Corynebacterium sp. SCR221107]
MSPIESAAVSVLGAIGLYAPTGFGLLLTLGGFLLLFVVARHIYSEERA